MRMKNLTNRDFLNLLNGLDACPEAVAWVEERDLRAAWQECPRADWMLWLLGKMAGKEGWPTRAQVAAAVCDCAETALKFVPAGEERPRRAISMARHYLRGEAALDEVRAAAAAVDAADAAYAAYAAAAIYAASAASADAAIEALRDMAALIRRAIPLEFE